MMDKQIKFFDILKKNKKDNKEKELVNQLVKSYKKKKESGEENPIDSTIEQIMDIINNSKNPDETAKKIIIAAIDANEMPNRIPEKLSIIISKTDNLSDYAITEAVEQSNTEVPDEMIDKIIEEGDLEQNDRLKLIKRVDNQELILKRIKKEFNVLYKNCKDKREDEIVSKLQELKQILNDNNIFIDIQENIDEIVAKKMAENYYNDSIKSTNVYRLSKAITLIKMFERDLASKVEDEYRKIEKQRGKKEEGRFNKEILDKQILNEIAKDIGYRYRNTGRFSISTSKRLQDISEESEKEFINTVLNSSNKKEVTQEDIQTIKIQIRGNKKVEEEKEYNLIKAIRHIEDKSQYLDVLINIVSDEEQLKTLNMISKSGLIENLSKIQSNTREPIITKISDTVKEKTSDKLENPNNNVKIENKEEIIIKENEEIDR